ncbi:response regulator transcription factor [Limnovirga soli]|uniref:Response regulator n=1 Tax=Limnovirga soli TaxID=2656915 RepID=A0A8J8JUM0_9BACT|nr:response regulator transcription factor [Limnovirga soli]NNV57168.1 response regulator [Limnovirga soli]
MQEIKVAVFEDNKARRELLKMLLETSEGFVCTGAFENCQHIIKNIVGCLPDVILMDIDMPGVNGIEGLKIVHTQFPQVKVLMQTIFEEEEKIFEAILAGADGYILKKTPPLKLLDAMREVLDGGAPMTPTVARQVLHLFNNKHYKNTPDNFDLTEREHEILKLLVKGLSYKMIAAECNISYATVNSHISHIYEKLHVSNAAEAVAKALGQRIV